MTVCVAAFAAKSEAIVLISDKAVTLGPMVSDTPICKMSQVGDTRWFALISGQISIADAVLLRCEEGLASEPSSADSLISMMKVASGAYADIYEDELIGQVLRPKLLTKTDAFQRARRLLPLSDELNREISRDREWFEGNWSCELLICGFDARDRPHMFRIVAPGRARGEDRLGFAAVGIGADAAVGRLMFIDSDRDDSLAKVLWDTFDAKVQAEIMQGVGYDWDAHVLLKSKPNEIVPVPREMRKLMDGAWKHFSGPSLFDTEPPEPHDIPPSDWKEQIRSFTDGLVPHATSKET